jgi:hypothetical protein
LQIDARLLRVHNNLRGVVDIDDLLRLEL